MIQRFTTRFNWIALFACLFVSAVQAATVTKIEERALAPLRDVPKSGHVRLHEIPLGESGRDVIDVDEFSVWAPDGRILIHTEQGIQEVVPPRTRFFRGLVNGDPQSMAFFAVKENGRVEGLVMTGDLKYAITANARRPEKGTAQRGDEPVDHFITQFDVADATPDSEISAWTCELGQLKARAPKEPAAAVQSEGAANAVPIAQGISGTQSYEITVEIETDFNLYQNAGSNSVTLTDYITNLTGAVSTIYNRDLHTNVVQKYINVYTTNLLDPWTSTSASNGLLELGTKYHNASIKPAGRRTSIVALLSGVNIGSGIAWEGVIGGSDFTVGSDWGGPYSWSGGIASFGGVGLGAIPDPNATVGGTPYGMPSGTQNYWPLEEYAHEVGHNMGGHHAHCVAVTDGERIASGFTDGSPATSASNFVDHCFGHGFQFDNGNTCWGGSAGTTNYVAGSQSVFKGTIMGYCHNVFISSVPQSRFIFAVPAEPSMHELNDYMLRAAGPLEPDGGPRNIVNGVGAFTISSITAPATLTPNSTGNLASVSAIPSTGATYAWTITNGTITSATNASSITFTAGASGTVVLRASGYNPERVGVTDSRSVAIVSVPTPATPTGVTAIGTSASNVNVTWNAAENAASYEIYRATVLNGAFTIVGTAPGTTFNDGTVAANTSYLYEVRGVNGAVNGAFSAADAATAITFTDPVLTAQTTTVKVLHFSQLLVGVNALRELAGLGDIVFSAPAPAANGLVTRQHLLDLRTGLDGARATLAESALAYTDPTITVGSTLIKSAHLTQLRDGLQ
jgi:hypothetical protein